MVVQDLFGVQEGLLRGWESEDGKVEMRERKRVFIIEDRQSRAAVSESEMKQRQAMTKTPSTVKSRQAASEYSDDF